MANFLGPYYTRINYHSPFGIHTMTLPTRTWNPDGGFGTFEAWDASAPAADVMINALVDKLKVGFDTGTVFDNFTIFKQLLPADDPQPVMAGNITSGTGTDAGGSWSTAVEVIMVARTDAFGIAKLTLLDAVSFDSFSPILSLSSGLYLDMFNEWSDVSNAWSGRDNSRPATFLKLTTNINQALRKEYHYD